MHREVIGLLTGKQRSKPSLVHLTRFSIFSREERQALRERYIVETCCARKGYSVGLCTYLKDRLTILLPPANATLGKLVLR